ncbi:MAG: glycosyltransferase [Pseudodesulfovibrio sp.]
MPVFNNWELTRQCLASLREHVGEIPNEVLLVDNASTDETATEAAGFGESLFGHSFRYLRQEKNLGFARAINLGANQASGKYLYLLNNDTITVSDPFSAPLDLLQSNQDLGATGPLLLYPGGERVQHLGITVPHSIKSVHLYHLFPANHPVVTKQRRFQAITMAAFLVERDLFLRLDGLHEGYVNGMEDIDFCARMNQEELYCSVAPEAIVHHIAGQSAGRFAQDIHNSRLLGSRCSQLLKPDMNIHAENDGYALRLTPWLDPYLVLGKELSTAMNSTWDTTPAPASLPELLQREPCWERGWELLADHCNNSGDMAGELSALVQKSAFSPTLPTFAAMNDAALRAGDQARVDSLAEQTTRLDAILSRPTSLRAQARGIMSRANDAGNDSLAAIMDAWITQHFPGKEAS